MNTLCERKKVKFLQSLIFNRFSDLDPSTWESQVLAPPDDLIATPQLHFDLGNLLPDTTYSIIIKIHLRDLPNMPQSSILTVRTLPSTLTTLPPQIPIDTGLAVDEVNSTWAKLNWKKFTQSELQFIDGVQVKYKDEDGKVGVNTPPAFYYDFYQYMRMICECLKRIFGYQNWSFEIVLTKV